MSTEWGPLGALIGEWEGEGGLDTAYSHAKPRRSGRPISRSARSSPSVPSDNGDQHLYGLDYRSAMWRDDEENPFHTEVGYWLWDAATGEVLRGFVVPRGITVLAGGTAEADADRFTLRATAGGERYCIGENTYLAENASTLSYEVTVNRGRAPGRTTILPPADERVRRAPRPHRPQHPEASRLSAGPAWGVAGAAAGGLAGAAPAGPPGLPGERRPGATTDRRTGLTLGPSTMESARIPGRRP